MDPQRQFTPARLQIDIDRESIDVRITITCNCGHFWSIRAKNGDRVKTVCPKCGKVYKAFGLITITGDIWELTE